MNDATGLPEAISIDDFCGRFGVCRVTVYKELRAGRLRARKFGKRTLIDASEAQRWWDSLPSFKPTAALAA